jgi:cbb3-type cytochrome oxidase cytochrome c subunit
LSAHWAEDGFYIAKEDIYISNGCMPALSVMIQSLSQRRQRNCTHTKL